MRVAVGRTRRLDPPSFLKGASGFLALAPAARSRSTATSRAAAPAKGTLSERSVRLDCRPLALGDADTLRCRAPDLSGTTEEQVRGPFVRSIPRTNLWINLSTTGTT
jgi:hypothetical protein